MRRRMLLALLAGCVAALVPVAVSAHPLGNFTVNHATQVVIDGDQLRVRHVIDMAEIPAFQAKQDMGGDATAWLQRRADAVRAAVQVNVDGHAAALQVSDRSMTWQPGQAGLDTLRIDVLLTARVAPDAAHTVTVHDGDDAGRIGWREITAGMADGASVDSADVPQQSPSDMLRHYPQDRLTDPLAVADAHLRIHSGDIAGGSSLLGPIGGATTAARDGLVDLLDSHGDGWLVILAMAAAMALGAAHALSPGHGKSVMAGYLVGTRRSWRDAVLLGGTITVTHTAGVIALGLLTLFASQAVAPERIYPVLTLGSGALILVVGVTLVAVRWRSARNGGPLARVHAHTHEHEHEHGHGHVHRHGEHVHPHAMGSGRGKNSSSRKGLLALGIAGGLVPCPSALLVLLAAVSLHRIAGGIVLILAFSAGLAATLVGIGIAICSGARVIRRVPQLARVRGLERAAAALPVASAVLISVAGLGLTVQAVSGVA